MDGNMASPLDRQQNEVSSHALVTDDVERGNGNSACETQNPPVPPRDTALRSGRSGGEEILIYGYFRIASPPRFS
jgi:hypothetical protein